MWAILSCIHGNLEALQAVLADAARARVDRFLCLGDIVGYGPNPLECIDLVRSRCDVTLLGNWEQATLFDTDGFGVVAERAAWWTRSLLEGRGIAEGRHRWQFLADLPRKHEERNLLFVHGSAYTPLNEYCFPEDIYNPRKMERIFNRIGHYCFAGHTHIPGVFIDQAACVDPKTDTDLPLTQDREWSFHAPEEIDHVYHLDEHKAIINVGSVGQPRDGNPRACYVLLDNDRVHFRRVEYDVETTVQKIYAVAELDNFLSDRLRDGR
jgi:predicted phosphodiesterase